MKYLASVLMSYTAQLQWGIPLLESGAIVLRITYFICILNIENDF